MLTEEDKLRLKLEEEFRYQVREEIAHAKRPRTAWAKIGRFFNSSFGLFFLSTIVIGFFSWSYSRWDTSRKIGAEQRERSRKLYIEIPFRIRRAHRALDEANEGPEGYGPGGMGTNEMKVVLPHLNGSQSIFPEFEDRPLFLLLYELHGIAPDAQKEEVKNLYEKSLTLYDLEPILLDQKPISVGGKDNPEASLKSIRWSLQQKAKALEKFDEIWFELIKAERWNIP